MLNGAQFVEAIGCLGYPGAASLKGSEFDWLFDCAPENLHFMRFVCRTLNPSNVITVEEARAFQELRKSGKPLLDNTALSKVLKTIGPSDGNSGNILGPSSNSFSSFVEEGDVSTEDLEAELQALRNEKELKQHRYNKLQVLGTTRSDVNLRLAAEQESSSCKLKEANAAIGAENAGNNASLESLVGELNTLGLHLLVEPDSKVQEGGNGETVAPLNPSRPQTTPVLLSRLSPEPYLQQEELNTKTLTAFTQKQFFEGISDIVSNSSPERFQVLDLSSCGVEEEDDEEEQQQKEGQRAVDRRRKEMAMLQWSHLVAQHQLLKAKAQENSIKTGIDRLSAKCSLAKSVSTTSSLQVRETVSRRELQAVEAEIEALLHGPVPVALREAARLINMPVVRGDLALQLARQDYYTSKQDQVRDYLLRQKSSFDLLLLALEMELRNWKTLLEWLENVRCRLVKSGEEAALRMEAMAHPDLAINPKPSPIISSKDTAFSRLLQILEAYKSNSGAGRADPFHTYEALDQAARNLASDLRSTREALAGALRQLSYTGARLSSDYKMLHSATHTELQQLVLAPQVRPAALTDQELCPNAQELSGKLVEVESQLKTLHHLMQNITDDVKAKRSQLERSVLLRRERELYVYFHLDPLLLQRVVEDQESKTASKGEWQ